MNAVRFQFETPAGEQFQINSYVSRLLRSQDLRAWRDRPEEFDAWLKAAIIEAISNTRATLQFAP